VGRILTVGKEDSFSSKNKQPATQQPTMGRQMKKRRKHPIRKWRKSNKELHFISIYKDTKILNAPVVSEEKPHPPPKNLKEKKRICSQIDITSG